MKKNQRKRKLSHANDETQKGQQRRFQTRWSTLKRKSKILGTICQGQVCMLLSRSNGTLEHWPNAAATKEIATKYLETRNVGAFLHKTLSLSDFPKIKKKNDASGQEFQVFNVEEPNKFSNDALLELSDFLQRKVESADSTLSPKAAVLNSMYMNDQESRNFCIAGSYGQSNNNTIGYNNSFPQRLGSSDCSNNPYEEGYDSAARNCGTSVISSAESIGFEGFDSNTMHQQSGQNMEGGFGGTDHPSQVDPSLISNAESICFPQLDQHHVNEVSSYQSYYAYEGVANHQSQYGHDQSTMYQQSRQNVDSIGGTYDPSQLDQIHTQPHFDEVTYYQSHNGHDQSTINQQRGQNMDHQPQLDQLQHQYQQQQSHIDEVQNYKFQHGHDA